MKLNKKLTVNGVKIALAEETVTLRLLAPGNAVFLAQSRETPDWLGGEARFSLGWDCQRALYQYFCGDVGKVTPAGDGLYRLHCLERSAVLAARLPLALRHPTLKETIRAYAGLTGLRFILPERPYAARRVPAFYALGSGLQGLDSLGGVFGIPDYFWQTQGDGQIYVGDYQDSNWPGKLPAIPAAFLSGGSAGGARLVSAIPALRPGLCLNGARVSRVTFSGHQMEFTC